MLKDVISKLHGSIDDADFMIFCGDISSEKELTIKFYSRFVAQFDFNAFKRFKKTINDLKKHKLQYKQKANIYEKYKQVEELFNLAEEQLIDSSAIKIRNEFVHYKNFYRQNETYKEAFLKYLNTASYKKHNNTENENKLCEYAKWLDAKTSLETRIQNYEREQNIYQNDLSYYENVYRKSVESITLADFCSNRINNIYAVLGNHEFIGFNNVDEAVKYYGKKLPAIGVNLLHNNYIETNKFIIYGGTGFAKYDIEWNAENVPCCNNFTRSDEFIETDKFEDEYKKALKYAKRKCKCFVCISHYPISACLEKYNQEAIYFSGHNHRNEFVRTNEKVLYADNQIGYDSIDTTFKTAKTGYYTNPYFNMKDGLYVTKVKDYIEFNRYIGIDIGKGTLIKKRIANGNFYVIKRNGYYGFFIEKQGKNKISIVTGGLTRIIHGLDNIYQVCEQFEEVLSTYLKVMLPIRKTQEQIAYELKEIGLWGRIHGLIVDADYYHHIMMNPYDGSITFYYSSKMGKAKQIYSFDEFLISLEYERWIEDSENMEDLKELYEIKLRNKNTILDKVKTSIETKKQNVDIYEVISREESKIENMGIYDLSRKINSLQYLFSGNVLREFNVDILEGAKEYNYIGNNDSKIINYDDTQP